MRCYTTQPQASWGSALHARTMSVCRVHHNGESLGHPHDHAHPETFLTVMAPSRDARVVAVACLFPWSWLADRCARDGLPCVLGHARSRQALQGGTANNDRSDAQNSAGLRRGGRLPQAAVSPAERRAPRARLRRRIPLMRPRAAFLTHGQPTNRQSTLPALGTKMASKANRDGVAERCAAPAGPQSRAGARALLGPDDQRRRDVALSIRPTATQHDATTRALLRTVPGIGASLRLVLLSASHDIQRVPRVPDCVSDCRLGTWAKASAGQRSGPAGPTLGHASLPWAFSEAAGLFVRAHPAGQQSLARVENTQGTGTALTILAHPCARAV